MLIASAFARQRICGAVRAAIHAAVRFLIPELLKDIFKCTSIFFIFYFLYRAVHLILKY